MMRYLKAVAAAFATLLVSPSFVVAQTLQDQLFHRALKATSCESENTPNNGRYCKYQFGPVLEVRIKDVGGTDTVVGFHNSNIKNELYAVLYFGCVAVVPGDAHPKNYDRNYGVFISPKTGQVYKSSRECTATLG